MKIRSLAALLAAASCSHAADTGTVTGMASPVVLDTLTVTAARYESPLASAPAMVTVLEADDLAPLATLPLEDILTRHAGVTLARSGGPGQQASIFLRGTNSDSTLVLVDGIRFNGGSFGGANIQHLRGADITRIEVIRGPRSTLYGTEAIGGVIAISTRAAGTVDRVRVHAESGSDSSTAARLSATTGNTDRGTSAGIGHVRTDGDPVTDRTTIEGRHENRSGSLNAHARIGNHRIGVDTMAARGNTRYVDCLYDPVTFACTGTRALNQDFYEGTASFWSQSAVGERTEVRTRIGHVTDEIEQQESADFARTERVSATFDVQHRVGDHRLVGGVDAEREEVDALVYGGQLRAANDQRSLFLRDDWTFGRQQLSLGARHARHDSFGEHVTGEASYGLWLADDTRAWLAAGHGFRAPDTGERYGFGGNPALAPEKSASGEAGLRQRIGAHELTVAGFVQRIDDLIDYPAPAYAATNIARARVTGTELAWSWRSELTRAEAMLTLLDAVDDSTGDRLARRPEKQLSAALRHRTGAVEWRASLLAMDRRDNSAFDNIELAGFAVLDLGAAWMVTPALTLDARIENAGDRTYVLASGSTGDYRMPDRGFFLGIDWQH